jgi:hypothetical protein
MVDIYMDFENERGLDIVEKGLTKVVKVPGNNEKNILGGYDFISGLNNRCGLKNNKPIFEEYCSMDGCGSCPYNNWVLRKFFGDSLINTEKCGID